MTFTDRNRIRLDGKLLSEGHLRGGVPLESAYDTNSKHRKGSGTSYVWAKEREHWESKGADYPTIEQAAKDSAKLVAIKSKDFGDLKKSTENDQKVIQQTQQELFALKKEAYYWSKVEKAAKGKAAGNADNTPPTPIKVEWHDHRVEEEPARIDIRDVVSDAQSDPSKAIALGGGDPGIRVTLEGQSLTLNELESYVNRYMGHANKFKELSSKHASDEKKPQAMNNYSCKNITIPHFSFTCTDHPDTQVMKPDPTKESDAKGGTDPLIRLPRPTRVSSKALNVISFTKKLQDVRRKRFRRKRPGRDGENDTDEDNDDQDDTDTNCSDLDDDRLDDALEVPVDQPAQDARDARFHMSKISDPANSLKNALSVDEVARVAKIRKDAHEPLRKLESCNQLVHMRKTQELRKTRAKAKVAASLKNAIDQHTLSSSSSTQPNSINSATGYCHICRTYHPPIIESVTGCPDESTQQHLVYRVACPKTKPQLISIIAYGAAGTGVGSRIGGNLRWGGNWLRRLLLQLDMVVVLTDEYNTTRMCVYCHHRMEEAKSTRLVGAETKTRSTRGSMCCLNPDCQAVKKGYAMRPRDSNAAVGILLSAMTIMLRPPDQPPWPIEPYSRYLRPARLPTPTNNTCVIQELTDASNSAQ